MFVKVFESLLNLVKFWVSICLATDEKLQSLFWELGQEALMKFVITVAYSVWYSIEL